MSALDRLWDDPEQGPGWSRTDEGTIRRHSFNAPTPLAQGERSRSKAKLKPLPDITWHAQANCLEGNRWGLTPSDFVQTIGSKHGVNQATLMLCCTSCPAREPCLEYALFYREHGWWAGTTEAERERIIRQRRKKARSA